MSARPTLETWLHPEHVRWSFRHVRELIPSERIARARTPRPLPPEPRPDLLDLVVPAVAGPQRVADLLITGRRDAMVVLHRGRLAAEWLGEGIGDREPHLAFSVTKSITGLLAGALAGSGRLDLEAPVVAVVPEAAGGAFADATVRQLLDMQAAYRFVEDYSPGPDIVAYRHAAGWYPAPADAPALEAFLLGREPDGAHGQRFRYLSPTCDLVGLVCARAAGSTWAEAVSRYLWEPMGAEADAEVTLDREGTPRAAGGLSAVPRDLARLGQLVAEGGGGAIPGWFVDDLLHAGSPEAWAAGDFAETFPGGCYRSFWYQPRQDPDAVCGIGIHGQLLWVDVPRQVVVVVLSSWAEADPDDDHADNVALARTIARAWD